MVDIELAAGWLKQGLLHHLLKEDVDASCYSTPVCKAIIQHKWQAFGREYIIQDMVLHGMALALYVAFTLLFKVPVTFVSS